MIRHAQFSDIPKCVELIRKANDRSENYQKRFNEKKVYNDLMLRVMNPYSLILVNDDISGVLTACAFESYFYSYRVVNEFFYAESNFLGFVRTFKEWAKGWGDNTDIDLCISYENNPRVIKIFEREGFRIVGPQMRLV